uniref:Uncharacterized protein n=1 Tax=Fundulus heteroclitus TaxID=8078 RepID=A0A3Q2QVL0_FUNHE
RIHLMHTCIQYFGKLSPMATVSPSLHIPHGFPPLCKRCCALSGSGICHVMLQVSAGSCRYITPAKRNLYSNTLLMAVAKIYQKVRRKLACTCVSQG